jgi:hypothetical protein
MDSINQLEEPVQFARVQASKGANMRDDAGYFHRTDDSGQDAMSIEMDWRREKERALRDLDGRELFEVLFDHRDTLAALSKQPEHSAAIGLLVVAAVRKYAEDRADISIFGRVCRKAAA